MIEPFYDRDGITIYHADCRHVLPQIEPGSVDLVLTDPPYPDDHTETYVQTDVSVLDRFACRQFVFWSARCDFPLTYTAVHIWDKRIGIGGQYERIFERFGESVYRVFRCSLINSPVTAQFAGDSWTGHPSQKPAQVLRTLISNSTHVGQTIVDPFMGSGTTLRAAKDLGRKAIGIEISEAYCRIAVDRLSQSVLPLEIGA